MISLSRSTAEMRLQGACVGALVGKLKAADVPEHVWTRLKAELGRDTQPRHHLPPPGRGEGGATLGCEHERRWWLLVAFEPSQHPQLEAAQRMNRRRAVLGSEAALLRRRHHPENDLGGLDARQGQMEGRPKRISWQCPKLATVRFDD
jgi:hypothetical protein